MEAKKIIITGGATRIGAAIAESLAGYDTNITIHYNKSKNLANKLRKKLEDLGSNVFLIKADLNNSNQVRKLIKDAFNKMKSNCILINCARGPLVDPSALFNALKNNIIPAAGIDVTEKEPISSEDPLVYQSHLQHSLLTDLLLHML